MLQSFRGTIDAHGIRTLRLERDEELDHHLGGRCAEFWAVLDSKEVPLIRTAVQTDNRHTALSLICERSVSFGTIVSRR